MGIRLVAGYDLALPIEVGLGVTRAPRIRTRHDIAR